MNQHQTYSQSMQQGKVMYQVGEAGIQYRLTAKADDKGAASMGMYVRGRPPEPIDKAIGGVVRGFAHTVLTHCL
jgi:hypothetical protein